MEHVEQLCERLEVPVLERRCETTGRLRCYRQSLPLSMGLASVLADDGLPQHHPGLHEHSAHPGIGRRSCAVPRL